MNSQFVPFLQRFHASTSLPSILNSPEWLIPPTVMKNRGSLSPLAHAYAWADGRPAIFRAVASLTVPGGQEFHFLHFFLEFYQFFLKLIFFFIFTLLCPPGGRVAHLGRPWLCHCLFWIVGRTVCEWGVRRGPGGWPPGGGCKGAVPPCLRNFCIWWA